MGCWSTVPSASAISVARLVLEPNRPSTEPGPSEGPSETTSSKQTPWLMTLRLWPSLQSTGSSLPKTRDRTAIQTKHLTVRCQAVIDRAVHKDRTVKLEANRISPICAAILSVTLARSPQLFVSIWISKGLAAETERTMVKRPTAWKS